MFQLEMLLENTADDLKQMLTQEKLINTIMKHAQILQVESTILYKLIHIPKSSHMRNKSLYKHKQNIKFIEQIVYTRGTKICKHRTKLNLVEQIIYTRGTKNCTHKTK